MAKKGHGGPRPKVREDDRRGWNAVGGADPHFDSYVPNEADREKVRTYAVVMTQKALASFMGISERSLRQYYGDEIAAAEGRANAVAGGKMYQLVQEGNVTALKYWLSTRGGWTQKHEISGPGGGPIPMVDHAVLATLTDEEFELYERLCQRLAPDGPRPQLAGGESGEGEAE